MTSPVNSVELRWLIWRNFRNSADEDYLVARWALRNSLVNQFLWSSQQCIEKYLKCALLQNNFSVHSFDHDLVPLYAKFQAELGNVTQAVFVPPRYFPDRPSKLNGTFEPFESFVARISDGGHSNQRYRHYSITVDRYDLHKLDALCYQIRLAAVPLDLQVNETGLTYREALSGNHSFLDQPELYPLGNKKTSGYRSRLLALSWRNFSFFEESARRAGRIATGVSSENSSIYLLSQFTKNSTAELQWVLEHLRLSRSDRAQMSEIIQKADR